jgi:hypothetical protein
MVFLFLLLKSSFLYKEAYINISIEKRGENRMETGVDAAPTRTGDTEY